MLLPALLTVVTGLLLLLLLLPLRVMRNANDVRGCHQIRKCAKKTSTKNGKTMNLNERHINADTYA